MTNFVLCIHVQIRFASTEKNYSHRLACILLCFLGIGRNTVTLPTSKAIPSNFPLSNIIFRKYMYRTIWTSVQWTVLNKTIQFPHKIQNQKKIATTC